MVKPEDRVKRRHLYNTHVTQSEDIVNTVVNSFKVANLSAIGLVAHLAVRLVGGEQLVDSVTNTSLRLVHYHVDVVVAAGSIGEVGIEWVSNSMLPLLELILSLEHRQYMIHRKHVYQLQVKCANTVTYQFTKYLFG